MKKFFRKIGRFVLKLVLAFVLISVAVVILYRFVPVPITPLMVIRCVEQFQNDEPLKLRKTWVGKDQLPNHLHLAVVCAEDQNFLNHSGFDFEAIEKAMEHNRKSNRKRGASTISQQTAKNLFLWPDRSWVRKGLEAWFTILIELTWPKERIITVYLNIIELGPGVYGAEAAASEFFGTSADRLTRIQSALLAAVLPNPRKYSAKSPGPYVRGRQAWVLGQMVKWGNRLDYDTDIKKN